MFINFLFIRASLSSKNQSTKSSSAVPTDSSSKKLDGSVWAAPPGLRSSASVNNDNTRQEKEKQLRIDPQLSEESFPDLREVYKQPGPEQIKIQPNQKNPIQQHDHHSYENSQEQRKEQSGVLSSSSTSKTNIPTQNNPKTPMNCDRPPGLAASQEAMYNQTNNLPDHHHFSNSNVGANNTWWEQSSSQNNESSNSTWGPGSWGLSNPPPPSSNSNSFYSQETQNNETGSSSLFDDWPELSQILEDKEFDNVAPSRSHPVNPSIPHQADKIPSSRIFGQPSQIQSPPSSSSQFHSSSSPDTTNEQNLLNESSSSTTDQGSYNRNLSSPSPPPSSNSQFMENNKPLNNLRVSGNDAHQLFRSLLPNVNVSFRSSPSNTTAGQPRIPGTTGPPPGIMQPREKWNPMAHGFNSSWQIFSSPSLEANSPQPQQQQAQPTQHHPNPNSFWGSTPSPNQPNLSSMNSYNSNNNVNPMHAQNNMNHVNSLANDFGWSSINQNHTTNNINNPNHPNNLSSRQEEQQQQQQQPAHHPFSLLSHLNQQSQFALQQQQQQRMATVGNNNNHNNEFSMQQNPDQPFSAVRQNHPMHFNPYMNQRNDSRNGHSPSPSKPWMNSHVHNIQQFPPGLTSDKDNNNPNPHFNSMSSMPFHRPLDPVQNGMRPGMSGPPGFNSGGVGHSKYALILFSLLFPFFSFSL